MVLIPVALIIGDTAAEIVALTASVKPVLIVERLNSAIEAVVGRFGDEWHELSGRTGDSGSATVLLRFVLRFSI